MEISIASGFGSGMEWPVPEIKGISELGPLHPTTEMGSYGSVDYYVTEWKDLLGRTNQYWRMLNQEETNPSGLSGF